MRILLALEAQSFYGQYVRDALADHDVRTMGSHAHFDDVLGTLPPTWIPDLVIFWFPENTCMPAGVEMCPYPTVAIMSDWNFNTEALRETASMFDAVVSDGYGLQVMGEVAGVEKFSGGYWAFEPRVHRRMPEVPPAYDVSVLGDLTMVQAERVRCMDRVSHLAGTYRVQFFNNTFDQEAYARYINATRITVNRTMRGEMNLRCFETPACGSLLFCESSNLDIREYLTDRQHCVLFEPDNIVHLLEYYLQHEDERARIAAAGHQEIQKYTYRKQIDGLLRRLQGLKVGPRRFRELPLPRQHAIRCAQAAFFTTGAEGLKRARLEAERGLALDPRNAELLNAYGCVLASAADGEADVTARQSLQQRADEMFSQVRGLGALPHISHANLLLRMGRPNDARALLEDTTADLVTPLTFYPRGLDRFTLEWGRNHEQRRRLVRWYIHWLLAELSPQRRTEHLHVAVEARPDIGLTWHLLASALPPGEECYQALRQAVQWDPLLLAARYDLLRAEWERDAGRGRQMAADFAKFLIAFPYPTSEMDKLQLFMQQLPR